MRKTHLCGVICILNITSHYASFLALGCLENSFKWKGNVYLTTTHPWAPTVFACRLHVTIFDSFVSLDINLNNLPLLSWINVFKLSVEVFTILILNQFPYRKRQLCPEITWALGFRPEEQPSNLFPRWWKGFLHLRCLRGPSSLVTQAENTRPQPEV